MANTDTLRKSSKGGRPSNGTLEQRLEQLLEDATQVFLQHGYGSASIDMIAREAHVAKRTIYQHFGDKDELFGAVVRRLSHNIFAAFPQAEETSQSVEHVLSTIARGVLALVLSPEAMGLQRIVIGEADRFPKLAQQFYTNGPNRGITALADYLANQQQLGTVQLEDPTNAATYFVSMIMGEFYLQALLGVIELPSAEQIDQHANSITHLFLHGYGSQLHSVTKRR
ncbi:TetR/AcrR family transcriptional regulator [Oscillatoria sp. CS-180]|uniref:TetR/AcrR family transcriptional regulator n=1 Tax=Oscillatoria sp. CS-180 TaxID=3021720 RepID=UPI00232DCF79|nr:TetR/AcrR family transcriptional regulator [Oscillatoria sp. CS-180]MDB9524566.1 TetR/AcrR family transcriptional regulator [Oscillatoria sp. CS-180]